MDQLTCDSAMRGKTAVGGKMELRRCRGRDRVEKMAAEDSLERPAREAKTRDGRGRMENCFGWRKGVYLLVDSGVASKIAESNRRELQLRR